MRIPNHTISRFRLFHLCSKQGANLICTEPRVGIGGSCHKSRCIDLTWAPFHLHIYASSRLLHPVIFESMHVMATDQGGQSLSVYPNRQEISPTNTVQDPATGHRGPQCCLPAERCDCRLAALHPYPAGTAAPPFPSYYVVVVFRRSFSQLVYFTTVAMMRFWRNDIDCFCIYPTSACPPL